MLAFALSSNLVLQHGQHKGILWPKSAHKNRSRIQPTGAHETFFSLHVHVRQPAHGFPENPIHRSPPRPVGCGWINISAV